VLLVRCVVCAPAPAVSHAEYVAKNTTPHAQSTLLSAPAAVRALDVAMDMLWPSGLVPLQVQPADITPSVPATAPLSPPEVPSAVAIAAPLESPLVRSLHMPNKLRPDGCDAHHTHALMQNGTLNNMLSTFVMRGFLHERDKGACTLYLLQHYHVDTYLADFTCAARPSSRLLDHKVVLCATSAHEKR
jgi:hypothetical protein